VYTVGLEVLMAFNFDKFPEGRDIYTLREIASLLYDIPISKIERWDMNYALKDMRDSGCYYRMFKGGQKSWPGGGGTHTFYCIRRVEKYRLPEGHRYWDIWEGDDWNKVYAELLKYGPPAQSELGAKQKRKKQETMEAYRARIRE
jgi:hypothetical protein